jgi:hyperosmotically inducible protein
MKKLKYFRALVAAGVLLCPMAAAGCGGGTSATVNRPAGSTDDATISTRVKTALLNEPGVNATAINVQTASGVVTLTGQVKSNDEVQKAVATARQIPGVKDVQSQLKVGGN